MTAAFMPLVVPGMLGVIIAQQWLYNRRLFSHVKRIGGRLTRLESIHLRYNPDDFDDLKIGGSL